MVPLSSKVLWGRMVSLVTALCSHPLAHVRITPVYDHYFGHWTTGLATGKEGLAVASNSTQVQSLTVEGM